MASEMDAKRDLRRLAEDLVTIHSNGGCRYAASNIGRRRYDPDTGVSYFTSAQPSELIVHGPRADALFRIMGNAAALATLIDAALQEAK